MHLAKSDNLAPPSSRQSKRRRVSESENSERRKKEKDENKETRKDDKPAEASKEASVSVWPSAVS